MDRSRTFLTSALAIVLTFAGITYARFPMPDLAKVPLKRLIGNLEKKQTAAPKDPELLRNLGRIYSMAYAAGLNEDSVVKTVSGSDVIPFLDSMPFALMLDEKKEVKRSTAYLEKAISYYKMAHELDKTDFLTMLGVAWCTDQLGKRDEAKKLYREVIAEAWKMEAHRDFQGVERFITAETIGYLMPLMDPKADKKEIADLKQKISQIQKLPMAISPVAIPLQENLDRAAMMDKNGVVFDLDGTGRKLRWQWLKPCAAWLVYDHDGSGQIDSAVQMFGNRTFMLFMEHGYAAMALLDDDGNGWLEGRELDNLFLWQDLNGNGISEPGEVLPLSTWRIKALSCRAEKSADGEWFSPEGVKFEDGSTRPTYDLIQHLVQELWMPVSIYRKGFC